MHRETTFDGLNHWYKHMFEKLGWMVLADYYEMDYKVETYKKSLYELDYHLKNKIKQLKNDDKISDLKVLRKNVVILINHVEKDSN